MTRTPEPDDQTVFRLIHFMVLAGRHADPEDESRHPKGIGTYRTVDEAFAAVERLRPLPGFRKWPDGFRVFPLVLDRVGWPAGFTEADADRCYWNWPTEEIMPPPCNSGRPPPDEDDLTSDEFA